MCADTDDSFRAVYFYYLKIAELNNVSLACAKLLFNSYCYFLFYENLS